MGIRTYRRISLAIDGTDLTGRLKVDAVNSLAAAGCSTSGYSYALQFTASAHGIGWL